MNIQKENYRGYTLSTKVDSSNAGQATLVYKDDKYITAVYADKKLENSIEKAKKAIDKKLG